VGILVGFPLVITGCVLATSSPVPRSSLTPKSTVPRL
jgi:hypothetical protein